MMSSTASEVIAFEPDPWAYAALLNNLSDLDNVVIENAAAGVSDGLVTFYGAPRFQRDPARYSQSSSVVAGKTNISANAGIEVRQIDFVRYLQDLDRDIGVLKTNIEGGEVDLLEEMLDRPEVLERIGWIFAETHEKRIPGSPPARRRASRQGPPDRTAVYRSELALTRLSLAPAVSGSASAPLAICGITRSEPNETRFRRIRRCTPLLVSAEIALEAGVSSADAPPSSR